MRYKMWPVNSRQFIELLILTRHSALRFVILCKSLFLLTDSELYTLERLVNRRKHSGRVQYEVKWEGYPSTMNSWQLSKDVPNMSKKAFMKNYTK